MRHLPVRPLVALLLSLCVWTVFTAPSHGQQTTATTLQRFPPVRGRRSRTGNRRRRRALARARPADDPAAVAVLAHITMSNAAATTRPSRRCSPPPPALRSVMPRSSSALLQQRLGRTDDASPVLNVIYRAVARGSGVAGCAPPAPRRSRPRARSERPVPMPLPHSDPIPRSIRPGGCCSSKSTTGPRR